jgi:predicted nucleic acid-binding protein
MDHPNFSSRYYFDANALFKYYKDEPGSLQIRRLVAGSSPILVSHLTLLECFGVIMKYRRDRILKTKQVNALFLRLGKDARSNAGSHPFEIVRLPDEAFKLAETVLFHYAAQFAISSNDALHLAIVQKLPAKPILVTSDKAMKKVCERMQISFFDPLIDNE